MKIREVITEDVDMSWQAEIDGFYNPEALDQIEHQEKRHKFISQHMPGTPVFRKPVRQSNGKFSNIPPKDAPKSAGYRGNVDVAVRAKHISKKRGKELSDIT